jgi:hypothetical protein
MLLDKSGEVSQIDIAVAVNPGHGNFVLRVMIRRPFPV